jgi:hypothetical protein
MAGWRSGRRVLPVPRRPVRFYGQNCSTAYVSTNGWLALGPPGPAGSADSNAAIPHPTEPNRFIAAYWDDLASAGSENGIWYQTLGDSLFVIEWRNFGYYGFEACSLNFEALIHSSGIVELEYAWVAAGDTLYDQGLSATVGIENGAGTTGLEYLHDGNPPGNLLWSGRAIRFLPREYGIQENLTPQASSHKLKATVMRRLPIGAVTFDAMGRRAQNPKAGVYFVGERLGIRSQRPGKIRKVLKVE